MRFHFEHAFTGTDWRRDLTLAVDERGHFAELPAPKPDDDIRTQTIHGVAVPGFVNAHSHAFQRGFAGLAECRITGRDSFWTWRDAMYEFTRTLQPEDCLRWARQAYAEMLQAGYTTVGEFHYLHNDPRGKNYTNRLAMIEPLVEAADEVGINLCILPVLYQRSGFGGSNPVGVQARFALSDDAFLDLVQDCRQRWSRTPWVQVGVAFHSLRAVAPETIQRVLSIVQGSIPNASVHIHVAEQAREVDECRQHFQASPVERLLDSCELDDHWCLVHATHATAAELQEIGARRAVVVLCPTTEANLGDGIFPAGTYAAAGGHWAIGSDSQVCIDPRSELRLLEYGQRLQTQTRAVLCDDHRSVGRWLCEASWKGGAQAVRMPVGRIEPGHSADFVVLGPDHPNLAGRSNDRLLDSLIFCERGDPVQSVYVRGQCRWEREEV